MTKRTRYFVFGSVTVLLVGLCTGLVAYYTGMPMGAFGQTSGLSELRYVPASASVVAYADVRNLMQSELRQKLHKAVNEKGQENGQAEFQRETGIDIENDIDRVVAFMEPGPDSDSYTGMVVATGRFDQGRLEALAREHGGVVEEYGGKRLISKANLADEGGEGDEGRHQGMHKSMTVAFLEPGVVAVGETAVIKRAIDRKGGESVTANKELMDLVQDIDDSNAWAVGRFDALMSRAKLPEGVASQIPSVRLFSASGHINGGLSGLIRAEARDDQAAQNLRDVVQGFLALAKMQANSQPEMQALVGSLQLSGTGKTVALSFTVPSQVIDSIAAAKQKAEE
jgi:hypothetical protein